MTTPSLSTPGVMVMLLLAVPACGDDSTAPGQEGSGVAFAYRGTLTGSFQAMGPASDAHDPGRSFAVAFRSPAGELQLCAYQAIGHGGGNFLLLNAGVAADPGAYVVPPGWAPTATSYQPGTLLLDVDVNRSSAAHISTFVEGTVQIAELSSLHVRGSFNVKSLLTKLADGHFDVPISNLAELPVICE
jgi:hypothetical protein